MSETAATWWDRWKEARKRHFSSADLLHEHLRNAGFKTARSTVLRWEGVPAGRQGYPDSAYRAELAGMNDDFAALIAEIPTERRGGAALMERLDRIEARLEEVRDLVRELRYHEEQPAAVAEG